MRPVKRIRLLRDLVQPARKTVVVDVGANPFNGAPPYALLRRGECCRVIGFEPQPEALASLLENAGPDETYLPYAVGSGTTETLHVTRNSGLVSVLEPEPWVGDYLNPWWKRATEVGERIRLDTRRLDDLDEIAEIDFLKIDIQGGELAVFRGARQKLANTAVIQTEVPILTYYKNQPTFGDVQAELSDQGFLLHKFVEISPHLLGFAAKAPGLKIPKSQITVVDAIYLRNPITMAELPDQTLRHMAILSDAVMGSYDLTLRCLGELLRRSLIDEGGIASYLGALEKSGAVARIDS